MIKFILLTLSFFSSLNASPLTLEAWLAAPIDSSEQVLTVGENGDLDWSTPSILFFGKQELIGLKEEYIPLLESHGLSNDTHFLSNFYIHPIVVDGTLYKSSEHAYQAMKFEKDSPVYLEILNADTPAEAQKIAWKNEKTAKLGDDTLMGGRMKKALWAKFLEGSSNEPNKLGIKLLATGSQLIVEGNKRVTPEGKDVTDRRWGMEAHFDHMPQSICFKGKNLLGKLLMELREIIQQL